MPLFLLLLLLLLLRLLLNDCLLKLHIRRWQLLLLLRNGLLQLHLRLLLHNGVLRLRVGRRHRLLVLLHIWRLKSNVRPWRLLFNGLLRLHVNHRRRPLQLLLRRLNKWLLPLYIRCWWQLLLLLLHKPRLEMLRQYLLCRLRLLRLRHCLLRHSLRLRHLQRKLVLLW